MVIQILTDCAQLVFDQPDAAAAFVRMLAHQISSADFVTIMGQLYPDPALVEQTNKIVVACMGNPA